MPDLLPRRRMLLASATTLPLLLAATGCRSSEAFDGPDPLARPPSPAPDVVTLEAVIAAEANLIELYKRAISGVSRATGPLVSEHEQHLVQLSARLVLPSPAPSASVRPSPGVSTAAPAPVTAAALRAAERESSVDLVRQLGGAEPALAQLFASIAACHATHVAALGG